MKSKSSKRQAKPKASGSRWDFVISIVVTIGIVAISYVYGQSIPNLQWIIPLALVALVLLALFIASRRAIWILLKSILTGGGLPRVIRKTENGSMQMKCPRCSSLVQVTPGHEGDPAFQCEKCDESATWKTELK
jgi:hypothetical protein